MSSSPRHACGVDLQELAVLHEAARGEPGHDMHLVLAELLHALHKIDGLEICKKSICPRTAGARPRSASSCCSWPLRLDLLCPPLDLSTSVVPAPTSHGSASIFRRAVFALGSPTRLRHDG